MPPPPGPTTRPCSKCGYDLTATAPCIDSDVWKCPECGWLTTQVDLELIASPKLKGKRRLAVWSTVLFNAALIIPFLCAGIDPLLVLGGLLLLGLGESTLVLWLVDEPRRQDQGFTPFLKTLAVIVGVPLLVWVLPLAALRLAGMI